MKKLWKVFKQNGKPKTNYINLT
eukprot:SAG31_NODE_26828_length_435_cov_2.940476_1_plen_22_part_01